MPLATSQRNNPTENQISVRNIYICIQGVAEITPGYSVFLSFKNRGGFSVASCIYKICASQISKYHVEKEKKNSRGIM